MRGCGYDAGDPGSVGESHRERSGNGYDCASGKTHKEVTQKEQNRCHKVSVSAGRLSDPDITEASEEGNNVHHGHN